jgi:hypothetical protein
LPKWGLLLLPELKINLQIVPEPNPAYLKQSVISKGWISSQAVALTASRTALSDLRNVYVPHIYLSDIRCYDYKMLSFS